ncbi:DUF624 domain-containing protein [Brachybacterium alimentarium]|uniref:DUF624 domain-containing protein n=1 Tax=Brachybacterium alimentarium TaxID=47845 RepID=UPI003FD2F1CA
MNDGPQRVPRWNLALNDGIEALVRLVHVSVLLLLLALLGLLLLGAGPAACAAVPVLQAARENRTVRVTSTMWAEFRGSFVPSTVRVTPLLLGAIAALGTVLLAAAGAVPIRAAAFPLAAVGAIACAWLSVSVAVMTTVPLVRRQDPLVALRLALLAPGALPGPSVALILALIGVGLLAVLLPPVGLLVCPALAVRFGLGLMRDRFESLIQAEQTRLDSPAAFPGQTGP